MSSGTTLSERLQQLALQPDGGGLNDGQLLDRFLRRGDQAAFEVLVRRHGAMVKGVCRRLLNNPHDAEDAFQAVFLVFIRRAASIQRRDHVGGWLYGVAYRLALKARAEIMRQRQRERELPDTVPDRKLENEIPIDWRPILDREVSCLPDRYRLPIILCVLEGRSRKEAAGMLGWTEGTLSGRLARARALLGKRLARYGIGSASCALIWNSVTQDASASISADVLQLIVCSGAVPSKVGGVLETSEQAIQWSERMVNIMKIDRIKHVLFSIGIVLTVGLGLFDLWNHRSAAGDQRLVKNRPVGNNAPKKQAVDRHTKVGRIFFYRKTRMASVKPNGKDFKWHSEQARKFMVYKPQPSPDGKQILYGGAKIPPLGQRPPRNPGDPDFEIYIKTVSEKGLGRKLPLRGQHWCWAGDGKKALVSAFNVDGPASWLVNLAEMKTTPVPLPPRHAATDISRDENWLLTTTIPTKGKFLKEPPAIYLVKKDRSKTRRLVPTLKAKGQAAALGRFSPDGRTVLYLQIAQKAGKKSMSVFAIAVNKGKPRRISQELNVDILGYCWSPDGKQIAYIWRQTHENAKPRQETDSFLMTVDADGGNPRTLLSVRSNNSGEITLSEPIWR